jgi:putative hydrolase of the HAD superfamily
LVETLLTRYLQDRSIVFDLFHTLVDPEAFRPKGFNRAYNIAETLSLEDEEKFAIWWRGTEPQRHISKSKKVVEFADDYLWKNVGRHCSEEELAKVNLICGQLQGLAILNPRQEVIAGLRELRDRKVRLGLLSNADESEVGNWSRSPISSFFQAACFSFEIGYSKPSKEAYSLVLEKLGATPSSAVFVGDGGHDELRGARDAGFGLVVFMKGFVSKNGIRTPEELTTSEIVADTTIMGLDELPGVMERL